MYDYLERVGLPSYVHRVEGFELSAERINEIVGFYTRLATIAEKTEPHTSRARLNELTYGEGVSPPKFHVYWVDGGPAVGCTEKQLFYIDRFMAETISLLSYIQNEMVTNLLMFFALLGLYIVMYEEDTLPVSRLIVYFGFLVYLVITTAMYVIGMGLMLS